MAAPATRSTIFRLMNAAAHGAGSCPCHGCRSQAALAAIPSAINALRGMATPVSSVPEKEYAFEVRLTSPREICGELMNGQIAAANLRFGDGVTKEVGMDLKNMKASKVPVSLYNDTYMLTYDIRLRYSRTRISPSFRPC